MRIYLDACCLNRPFDDQAQDRIRLESEAVLLVLTHVHSGEWQWIGSEVLNYEIEQTPDPERRSRVKLLASFAKDFVRVGKPELDRALQLESLGFSSYDAMHIACAESGGGEVFLTTDYQLLRLATRWSGQIRLRVANPLTWLEEVTGK